MIALYQKRITRSEMMIFTTISAFSAALLLMEGQSPTGELKELLNGIGWFLIVGLAAILGTIMWRWIDAVNENTKTLRELALLMTRHDEKIKVHDEKFERITDDVHEIRGEIKDMKSEIKSEIHKTVKDVIEKHKDLRGGDNT